jgi:tetratricopeptide (TPR) repeat protein
MRRVLVAAALLGAALLFGDAWATYTRDVEYGRLVTRGEEALADDDTGAAVEAFSGAIALRPASMVGWYKRGETYRIRGDLPAALRDLRRAVALDPAATRPLELLGDVLFALDRHPRAAERYAAYLAIDDRSPRVAYKLALSRFREGSLDACDRALQQTLALQESLPEAHYLLGLLRTQQGRLPDAATAFRRAVALNPSTIAPREALAATAGRLGRSAEHVRQLEELVRLDPDRVGRLVALAAAYEQQGRRDAAVQTLTRGTQQFPSAHEPYAALARLWLAADEDAPDPAALAKAQEAAVRAVDRARTSDALTQLGHALLRAGDRRGALRALEEAVSVAPSDPAAYPLLAEAAEAAGRLPLAREAWLRADALAGDASRPAAARRAIRLATISLRLGDGAGRSHWLARAADLAGGDPQLSRLVADAAAVPARTRAR